MSAPGGVRAAGWGWTSLLVVAGLTIWAPLTVLAAMTGCRPQGANMLAGLVGAALATGLAAGALHRHAGAGPGRAAARGVAAAAAIAALLAVTIAGMPDLDERKAARTIADMRRFAQALDGMAGQAGGRYPAGMTAIELGGTLGLRDPILRDAWGQPLELAVREDRFVLRSPGRCGAFEHADPWAPPPPLPWAPERDIVCDTGRITSPIDEPPT